MIPILYESTETAFTSNGLGRLRDCISCKVTEQRNSVYEAEFEYPVTGAHFNEITIGRIIAVEHDDTGDVQPFDIVGYTRPINGVVTFRAVHISYRLNSIVIDASAVGANRLSQAFFLFDHPVGDVTNPFSFESDITAQRYIGCFDRIPKSIRSVLGGVEGSLLDAFGGEYEFDKFNVILHSQRGVDRNFTIRYGLNMSDYNEEVDNSETYMRVYPYWTDGTKVIQGHAQEYGRTITNRGETVALDVSDKFESEPATNTEVDAAGLAVFKEMDAALPVQSIEVEFVRLSDTDEYAQYKALQQCRLCDTVRVIFPMYGTEGRYKIVTTVYDVLLERFESMELGATGTTLSEALGLDGSDSKPIQPAVTKALSASDFSISAGEFVSGSITTIGRVAFLTVEFRNTASTASGSNIFRATLNSAEYYPLQMATGASYYSSHALGVRLTSSGDLIVRNASSAAVTISSSNSTTFSLTYLT